MANSNPLHLIQIALEDLRKRNIKLPSMATIERAVWETRKRTEEKIFKLLSSLLTKIQIAKLDRVLTTIGKRQNLLGMIKGNSWYQLAGFILEGY